ncbi:MAG TPA: type III pantothenate kinase [Spirochaetota bacterium]|nr:type III pantothenate kinase [Spirochaetota bacterium]HOM38420.1 type III pantothenate kinase [Spirochaetota bacterium]HPQ48959.1 type III pantothenate kinase [Spirochaetota bacterium]
MFAGIDIGNTTVRICFFDNFGNLLDNFIIYEINNIDFKYLISVLENVNCSVIVSVVDRIENEFIKIFKNFSIEFYQINKDQIDSIDFSSYTSYLGSDRVATCLGGLYYDKLPFCIIDMGTATTFSVVDKNKKYQGGFIIPGIGTMLRSLNEFTAKLPLVNINDEIEFKLGLNTEDNIRNGIYLLNFEGIKHILNNIKKSYPDITFIGTGGWSRIFNKIFDINDPLLIFRGMNYFIRRKVLNVI